MKTAFITGASSGFGRACVEAFIQKGYKVIALARRKERLEELKILTKIRFTRFA